MVGKNGELWELLRVVPVLYSLREREILSGVGLGRMTEHARVKEHGVDLRVSKVQAFHFH